MKHYLVIALWVGLFLFDITIGLHLSFNIVLLILFIATGVLTSLYKSFRPVHLIEFIVWVPVSGWLILLTYGLSIELLPSLMPQTPFFVYRPYLSWAGFASILVVSFIFSLFGYSVFQTKAIYMNFTAGILAASLIIVISDTKHAIYLTEPAALVIVLCLATCAIQRLVSRLSGRN
ncbi:MAG TPA: hypothetical protein ENJ08_16895 [Gammaproteobacteria bacterium]|nr:hypothetical protein [Gammaproteobacteria bacterium]